MLRIKTEIIGLQDMIHDVKNSISETKINRAIEQVAIFVEAQAKSWCPSWFGHLQKNIIHYPSGHLEWTVCANTEYAEYLEYGTKSHFIEPVSKEALHWSQGGQHFFSKGHMVSGIKVGTETAPLITTNTKGISSYRPFLRPAFYTNEGKVEQIIDKVLSEGEANE